MFINVDAGLSSIQVNETKENAKGMMEKKLIYFIERINIVKSMYYCTRTIFNHGLMG